MGVPKFFAWLQRNYKKKQFVFQREKTENEVIDNIDWFLIDTNCLIHPICFETLAKEQESGNTNINFKSLENKMINNVIAYIEKLINYVKPKEGIYIAIDGPVCAAKIKQQRQRRFRSVHDKELFNKIKEKYNKPINYYWNNSAISPGTKFMYKLHLKLLEWSKNQKLKIIYSSANTPGEGEHKLLDFIKDNNKKNIIKSYVTYGLDADLIFLMLVTGLDNVFLLREAQHFDNKKSEDELNYVSIKIMKDCIFDSFNQENSEIKLDQKRVINDFIFLCYFLGNDFLPHLYGLDINKDGIEYLIRKYTETYMTIFDYLLSNDTKSINQGFLKLFLIKLAENEDAIMTSNFSKKKMFRSNNSDPYEKEMDKINHVLFKVNDPVGLGVDSNYRVNYYKHYFDVDDDELEEFVERLVKNYLIGIRWVTSYYFQENPDWNWYYPYDYPPFLSDISKYLIKMNEIKFILNKPMTPFEQLLTILPPQASYLLTPKLAKLVTNPKSSLSHLYPHDFDVDFLYKHKYYEGIPILPPLEIKLVRYIYSKYKDELSEEDKNRNKIVSAYIF
jgi:5'-3' exonuclease